MPLSIDAIHEPGVLAVAPRLRQFVVVAREQHVTRAAALLGLAQSTLSRNIARLEADLGAVLFHRAGRTLTLTRYGEQLLPHVERALAELSTGLGQLAEDLHPERGKVALAFLHSLGVRVVPVIVRDFRSHHPGIRFTLTQDSHDAMLDKLRRGAVDLCLTSPVPNTPDLNARKLDEQRLNLVVPRGHRLAGRSRIRLAEAANEDFVGLQHGYGLRRITDDWCRQAGFTPRMTFEGEEIDTVLGLVAAGLGVALLPTGRSSIQDGPSIRRDVVELEVTSPRTTRTIALVWLADRTLPPAVDAFRESVLGYRGRLLAAR